MRSWLVVCACGVVVVAVGCLGDGFSQGPSSSSTSGGGGTTSSGGTGGSATTSSSSSASSSSGAGGCPNLAGLYKVTDQGQGCGDLNTFSPVCIRQQSGSCQVQFASAQAVNGQADLDMSGDFMNADVKLGSTDRSGCNGMWTPSASVLAINCGGTMQSTQMCTATLARSSNTCPF